MPVGAHTAALSTHAVESAFEASAGAVCSAAAPCIVGTELQLFIDLRLGLVWGSATIQLKTHTTLV